MMMMMMQRMKRKKMMMVTVMKMMKDFDDNVKAHKSGIDLTSAMSYF